MLESNKLTTETDQGGKIFLNGAHRCRHPSDTLASIRNLVDSAGITRLANLTGLDRVDLPVYSAIRPTSFSNSMSYGKGIDHIAAQTGATMESLELFYAEQFYFSNVEHQAISGIELIHGRKCNFEINEIHTVFEKSVVESTNNKIIGSNGLASGNTLSEAACHAIFELVERDAINIWTYASDEYRCKSKIDLQSIESNLVNQLLKQINEKDIEIVLYDATCDTHICVVVAFLVDLRATAESMLRVTSSCGSHSSREIATCRAITEAAQRRITFISGSRDDIEWELYKPNPMREKLVKILQQLPGEKNYYALPDFSTDNIDQDLEIVKETIHVFLLSQYDSRGIRVKNLIPHNDSPIAVVKVVIDSLEQPFFFFNSDLNTNNRFAKRLLQIGAR